MRTILPHNSPVSLGILRGSSFVPLALLLAVALGGTQMGGAQVSRTQMGGAQALAAPASAAAHQPASTHKPVHARKRHAAVKAPQVKAQGKTQATAAPAAPAPAAPPAPELPKWPANEKAGQATVTWDSQGLRIEAANSSLEQILMEVSTLTGAKLEGFDADQRVFGAFGPGPARDVLSQLLLGSGYNVVMIGDQGQGTPRRIVLSSRHAGGAQPAATPAPASSDEDADTEEQPQQPQPQNPPPIRPGFPPGGRTPQQMQEMQRQQQMHPQPGQPQPPSSPQN